MAVDGPYIGVVAAAEGVADVPSSAGTDVLDHFHGFRVSGVTGVLDGVGVDRQGVIVAGTCRKYLFNHFLL